MYKQVIITKWKQLKPTVLDTNTKNNISVCKLFVLDRNT